LGRDARRPLCETETDRIRGAAAAVALSHFAQSCVPPPARAFMPSVAAAATLVYAVLTPCSYAHACPLVYSQCLLQPTAYCIRRRGPS
jgi:hypothetical protein